MTTKRTYILLLFSFLYFISKAQKTITYQSLYWMRYYNQLSIDKKLTWHNEIDNRRFFENSRQHHLIMHTRLHVAVLPNIDVAFGLTYSRQSPQEPHPAYNLVVPEIRPVQEMNLTNLFGKRLTLQQRVRVDERFIRKNSGNELLDGYDFNFRFRYRLQLSYKISKENAKNQTTVKISGELMINAGKNIIYNHFDQNRVYIAIDQAINKVFSVELGYLHWYQQKVTGSQFFRRDILRLTILHKWKLPQKPGTKKEEI